MHLLFTIISFFAFYEPKPLSDDGVVIELQNNCGKKVELEVQLLHNIMNLTVDSGMKNKFRLKVGSDILVNNKKIRQVLNTDNGTIIKLSN